MLYDKKNQRAYTVFSLQWVKSKQNNFKVFSEQVMVSTMRYTKIEGFVPKIPHTKYKTPALPVLEYQHEM